MVCDELKRVTSDVSVEEMDRAKAQLKASIMMSMESSGSRCEQIARQLQIFGRILDAEEILAAIDAVQPEQVMKSAAGIFSATPTLTAMGDLAKLESWDSIRNRLA